MADRERHSALHVVAIRPSKYLDMAANLAPGEPVSKLIKDRNMLSDIPYRVSWLPWRVFRVPVIRIVAFR